MSAAISAIRRLRFMEHGGSSGAENMAVDEALSLSAVDGGEATLRVYRFEPPCISIGRFQPYPGALDLDACEAHGVEVVRRPTGGLAILHLDDFTYSFTAPVASSGLDAKRYYFLLVAQAILRSLQQLGVEASVSEHLLDPPARGTWCFERARGIDLEWQGRKLCGSAQRIAGGGLLQHGSLFLRRQSGLTERLGAGEGLSSVEESPLVTVDEAAGKQVTWSLMRDAFVDSFADSLGAELVRGELSACERELAEQLTRDKYGAAAWLAGSKGGSERQTRYVMIDPKAHEGRQQ